MAGLPPEASSDAASTGASATDGVVLSGVKKAMSGGTAAESLVTLRAALANLSFFSTFRKFCEE